MKCAVCKHGTTKAGAVTVTLEREGRTVVFRQTPAEICDNCGEEYVDAQTSARILEAFEAVLSDGVMMDIRQYLAA